MRYSVIIPCKDETKNMKLLFDKVVSKLPLDVEMVFVLNKTELPDKIKKFRNVKIFYDKGEGKSKAVKLGIKKAKGDIIAIYDADATISIRELMHLCSFGEKGVLVIGSRLIYPMEKGAMRLMNKLGNKVFALIFSFILQQKITDTLCGTKILHRNDARKIKFKEEDPFGDFTFLFEAKRLELKIREVPVHYKARKQGKTKTKTFKDGWKLLKCLIKNL